MKKKLLALCLCVAMTFSLAACGSSGSSSSEDTTTEESTSDVSVVEEKEEPEKEVVIEDAVIEHRVFQTANEEGYVEFVTIFYGCDTKKLIAMNDEALFLKSANYSKDGIESQLDMESIYPGFSTMPGATYELTEDDTYVRLALKFPGLDKHWKEAAERDLIIITEENEYTQYIDAESLCQSFIDGGSPELDAATYAQYNLNFSYE